MSRRQSKERCLQALKLILGTAFLSLPAGNSFAISKFDAIVGAQAIATKNNSKTFACDQFITQRRINSTLSPSFHEGRSDLLLRASATASISAKSEATLIEDAVEASLKQASGRHTGTLDLGIGYRDAEVFGCSATVEDRLAQERAIRELKALDASTHSTTADTGYSYGVESSKVSLHYLRTTTTSTLLKDKFEAIGLRGDQHFGLNLRTYAELLNGKRAGALGTYFSNRLDTGITYLPAQDFVFRADTSAELRTANEQVYVTTLSMLHQITRPLTAVVSTTQRTQVHSPLVSQRQGDASLTLTRPLTALSVSARRIEFLNPEHSAGNSYRAGMTQTLARQHKVGLEFGYGTQDPIVAKLVRSTAISHDIAFGVAPKARTAFSTSYVHTRFKDQADVDSTVQQWQFSIIASF